MILFHYFYSLHNSVCSYFSWISASISKKWACNFSFSYLYGFHIKIWRRKWQPTPVFLPGESCGWRSVLCLAAQQCPTLCDPMDFNPPGSSVLGDSPSKNTGVGFHALLQGIFATQGLSPGVLHFRQILYPLSHQGSPRILDWVAYPFSRGPSQPRNRTKVFCIVGGFFTS